MNTKLRHYIRSTIPIKASILSNKSQIKIKMANYPNCKLLEGSKWPAFIIASKDSDIKFYIIELKEDSILFSIYSNSSPLYSLQESLFRLSSIIYLLSDDYLIYANNILPYFIQFLLKSESNLNTKSKMNSKEPELILSRRIISLMSENKRLKESLGRSENYLLRIASDLIISKYGTDSNIKLIETATGLDTKYISRVLCSIQQNGHKLAYNRKGNFNIVKL